LIVSLLSSLELSEAENIVLMPIFFYAFGIILWLVPYTVLAIGMWVWSRNKSTSALYKAALIAPLLFLVLILIEAALVSLPVESVSEFANELFGQLVLLGGFSLAFGYLCVGVALGVFKFLKSGNRIAEETPTQTA
jgi:hypothetical protein